MVELVTLLNEHMRSLAADHVADEPAKTNYRIDLDTRFSRDKNPYKTHIAPSSPTESSLGTAVPGTTLRCPTRTWASPAGFTCRSPKNFRRSAQPSPLTQRNF